MAIRVTMSPDGQATFSNPDHIQEQPQTEPQASPQERPVAGVRYEYNSANDTITAKTSVRAQIGGVQPTAGDDPLDFGMNNGSVVSRDQLTPDSIIDSPAIGGSMRLREALNLGFVKRVNGEYVFVGVDGGYQEPQNNAPAPAPAAVNDGSEIDGTGIEPTSATEDIAHNMLKRDLPPATYQALISTYVSGGDPSAMMGDVARFTKQTPEEARKASDFVFKAYDRAAKAVAAKAGVSAAEWPSFVAFVSQHAPDKGTDAMLALVNHQITPLAKLARAYSRSVQR